MKHVHKWIEDPYIVRSYKLLGLPPLSEKEKILICTICGKKRFKWSRNAKRSGKFTTRLAGYLPYEGLASLGI
jgi:hypothetical protein